MPAQKIEIYGGGGDEIEVSLDIEQQTLWLNLNQIAALFDRDKSVISRHIKNVFDERELLRSSTVAKNATVQKEGDRKISRDIEYYNLDVIISVGYRVNSKRGTQFRIWATNTLRNYLVDGFVINQKKLNGDSKKLAALQSQLKILKKVYKTEEFGEHEARALIKLITDYSSGLELIDSYDKGRITPSQTEIRELVRLCSSDF